MKVYSPSSTLTFQVCPMLWSLKQQGYESKKIGNPTLAAAVGIGVSAGMEAYYKERGIDESIRIGQTSATHFLQSKLDTGAMVVPRSESTFLVVPDRVEKAIRGFHKKQPFPSDWHSFIPELVFPDHGKARADLLCQSDLGPCIVDFKTKVTVQDYILEQFIQEMETSHQLYHYVWAGRQMGLNIQSFAICLIVIEPLKIYLEQWVVDEEYLLKWEESTKWWWSQMEQVEQTGYVPMSSVHATRYGLCEMYDFCINGVEMAYTKKERAV